jgi:hypothetical protein
MLKMSHNGAENQNVLNFTLVKSGRFSQTFLKRKPDSRDFILISPRRVARWYIFKPKIPLWVNYEGPWNWKKVGIFYGYLEYITAIWYMLWPFGNVVTIWYISPRFGILCQEKSGSPALQPMLTINVTVYIFIGTFGSTK